MTTHLLGQPMSIICAKCGDSLTVAESGFACPKCGSYERASASSDNSVAVDKAEVARELARMHYQMEFGITQILRFTHRSETEVARAEPIKLLEVNSNTVPSGVMPLYFGPAPASGIHYPSVIVEVTPDEYLKIQSHELKLPAGWDISEPLPKPSVCLGGA